MDSNTFSTLIDFRQGLYDCFLRAGDVLMNTNDALLSHTDAQSLVELSLSAYFERRWSSLYDAFDNAKIDRMTPLGAKRPWHIDAAGGASTLPGPEASFRFDHRGPVPIESRPGSQK